MKRLVVVGDEYVLSELRNVLLELFAAAGASWTETGAEIALTGFDHERAAYVLEERLRRLLVPEILAALVEGGDLPAAVLEAAKTEH